MGSAAAAAGKALSSPPHPQRWNKVAGAMEWPSPTKFFPDKPRHHLFDPLLPNNGIARVPHLLVVREVDAFKRRWHRRLLRLEELGLGSRHGGQWKPGRR